MNHKAIDLGATAYKKFDVPADWADAKDETVTTKLTGREGVVKQVEDIMFPVGRMDGDSCLFPPSCLMWTVSSSRALPLMRSAACPSPFLLGTLPSASSATTAHMSAPMLPSVPSL